MVSVASVYIFLCLIGIEAADASCNVEMNSLVAESTSLFNIRSQSVLSKVEVRRAMFMFE